MKELLGKIFTGSLREFCEKADCAMLEKGKLFVVTANPEALMMSEKNPALRELLLSDKTTITPDGIGVVRAMQAHGLNTQGRVTGVDISRHLLKTAGENGKSVFLFGAQEDVVFTLAKKLKSEYPNITVHFCNGYVKDRDAVFKEIKALSPDLVLVALGVPAQELLIWKHLELFPSGVFVGVGGSFDVLSGRKKPAPKLFVKTNTEWLYRIIKEPSRLKRFYHSNIKFIRYMKKQ